MAAASAKERVSPQRKYLTTLGSESLRELEDRVVARVLTTMRERHSLSAPVKLSRIADRFRIDPIPKFDATVPHGRLTYDLAAGKFIITLGASEWRNEETATAVGLFRDWPSTNDPIITRRLRFTYAHEMAHRFLFVEEDGSWVRALTLSSTSKLQSARDADLRKLSFNEERLCDRIAGRILVPEDLLREPLAQDFVAVANRQPFDFHRVLKNLSDHFAVTAACMLVQIQRALQKGTVKAPPDFCAFLVGESESVGSGMRSGRKLRIKSAIMPKLIGEAPIAGIFPGLALDNLGEAFEQCVVFANVNRPSSGDIKVAIKLRKKQPEANERPLEAEFEGWWWSGRRATQPETAGVLVWGRVHEFCA